MLELKKGIGLKRSRCSRELRGQALNSSPLVQPEAMRERIGVGMSSSSVQSGLEEEKRLDSSRYCLVWSSACLPVWLTGCRQGGKGNGLAIGELPGQTER